MADTLKIRQDVYRDSIPLPRLIDNIELDDASANSWTVPDGTRFVLIATDNPVYVRVAATAVVPTGDVTDGTASLYIPATGSFEVEEGVALSFIRATGTATQVSIGRYSA